MASRPSFYNLLSAWWEANSAWAGPALVYVSGAASFCVSLTGDQKYYLSHMVEMREQGVWLYPLLFGGHEFNKPPFAHWTVLASWKVFGFSSFGTFLPFALALVATCAILPSLTRSRAPVASWLYAGSIATLMFGSSAQMEVWVGLAVALLGYGLKGFDANAGSRHAHRYLTLALAVAGWSAMIKSPVYTVLHLASVWGFLLWRGHLRTLIRRAWFWAAHALAACIGGAWYVAVIATDWLAFKSRYLDREHAEKLAGNGISVFKMSAEFLLLCMPWMLLLAIPLARLLLWGSKRPKLDAHSQLLVCLATPPALFFAFFPFRMDAYLYVLMPVLVLWVADGFTTSSNAPTFLTVRSWAPRLSGVLLVAVSAVAAPVLMLAGIVNRGTGIALFCAACAYGYYSWKGDSRKLAAAALVVVALIKLAALRLGSQDIAGLRAWVAAHPAARLSMFDGTRDQWHEVGYLSVGAGQTIHRVYSVTDAAAALRTGDAVILDHFAVPEQLPKLKAALGKDASRLNHFVWQRWKRGIYQITPHSLLQLTDSSTDAWKESNQKQFAILTLAGS